MPEGAYKPAALRFLARVVERHCVARGITWKEGRRTVATAVLTHYNSGLTNEADLLAALGKERDPSRPPDGGDADQSP